MRLSEAAALRADKPATVALSALTVLFPGRRKDRNDKDGHSGRGRIDLVYSGIEGPQHNLRSLIADCAWQVADNT